MELRLGARIVIARIELVVALRVGRCLLLLVVIVEKVVLDNLIRRHVDLLKMRLKLLLNESNIIYLILTLLQVFNLVQGATFLDLLGQCIKRVVISGTLEHLGETVQRTLQHLVGLAPKYLVESGDDAVLDAVIDI